MQEIDDLVAQGYRVKVQHLRKAVPVVVERGLTRATYEVAAPFTKWKLREMGFEPSPLGGITVVKLTTPNEIQFTERVYVSDKDNYCKATGVKLGLERLMDTIAKNTAVPV